eukprot:2966626-Pyramimonas_sp.AAC.1
MNIGARTGRAVVVVNIVTTIAAMIIVSIFVDVAVIPRPPKSPTGTEMSAGMCPAVSGAAAASVAPNYSQRA